MTVPDLSNINKNPNIDYPLDNGIELHTRLNLEEDKIFPYPEYLVFVSNTDTHDAICHVVKNDWELTFDLIDFNNGLLKTISEGFDKSVYLYIIKNIHQWYKLDNILYPPISNRANATLAWSHLRYTY